ncbi:hypothetical protein QES_0660 [Clostridioides difficile CD149]|nr:hypothetical protein QAQ_0516 [Clostridioides difficile CD8]EQE22809.1 hypothetical protein QAY_0521 [Clostridioides difficile CD18]EQE24392.1 hypothetical protein QAW_0535 [Clostridioides difficile CD17]EQE28162.1 hypothetical protein QC1_0679 [Clostridioides difficile CD21]EQE47738.1 hypothetical protein QCA_0534 [Clostridioides difficile CD40]EQE58323.1 hypothetical protein QCE_0500 [Clostridioides difficile CD42]EQE69149.1 hypothetical protein QCI_0521 [Clostridioides difficile CD44]E
MLSILSVKWRIKLIQILKFELIYKKACFILLYEASFLF